ncbi:hypothetical protein Tco_1199082 [Tanacetum coccineum]
MARQCTQPKRPRNVAWFKEKAMLAEAYEAGQILDEEQLAFLADLGIPDEVPHSDSYHNDMDNQSVHAMQDFEKTPGVDFSNNEIHSNSNIILYSQYLQETQLGDNTLAEYMILSGAENHPPVLDKDLYDSWKSRMELYMQNREHGRMILESVKNGPLIWPTVEENGVTRIKKYAELFAAKKVQADCDMKATNIILKGLPAGIYSLVNHHKVAKDLWERVQLLMQGTSLTKQERECKLYDAFDKFTHIKGESHHNLPPERSKFVTDVKLVKDLNTTNFDQLHAYLEQHKLHANEVCLLRERNQDPLAFVANQQMTPPDFNTYQSSHNNP